MVRDHFESQDNNYWLASERVERLVSKGEIKAAELLLKEISPGVLQDQRLYFRLKRQQFVEYLRDHKKEGLCQGLAFLRQELAPLALDAYPEAYEELRHCLLTLIFHEGDAVTHVSEDWDPCTRQHLGAQLGRCLRQAKDCYDSKLAMLVRYLITTHEAHMRLDRASPWCDPEMQQLIDSLGVDPKKRAPPPTPPNTYLLGTDPINHLPVSLIMMLKSSFPGLSREDAINGLRATGCNVERTFQFEASALPINRMVLNKLAREYATSRGFGKKGPLVEDGPVDMDTDGILEERRNSGGAATPSNQLLSEGCKSLASRGGSQSPPKKVARCDPSPSSQVFSVPEADWQALKPPGVHDPKGALQQLRVSIEKGNVDEAIEQIYRLDHEFFSTHPGLHFELLSVRFQQLVASGRTKEALTLARTKLTPISDRHPWLHPQLKAALAKLIAGSSDSATASLTGLADTVENELRNVLGVAEPKLTQLLKMLLQAHVDYFRVQQCEDPFATYLDINPLRNSSRDPISLAPTGGLAGVDPDSQADGQPAGSARVNEPTREYPEELILEAMDVTNLGRRAVIAMLHDANGNLEELLENMFA